MIPLQFDLGHLMVSSLNTEELDTSRSDLERQLLDLTTSSVQGLLNEVFSLEATIDEDGPYVSLPEPRLALPRAKPVPKPEPLTKWQQFAQKKGIKKEKRSAMVYDEQIDDYRPRHGPKSKNNDPLHDWVQEVKD